MGVLFSNDGNDYVDTKLKVKSLIQRIASEIVRVFALEKIRTLNKFNIRRCRKLEKFSTGNDQRGKNA